MYSNVQDIDLRLLRIFDTIAASGGFSAAQAPLNMSQSAISTQMATLETRLGCRLCERGKSGFRLTEKGARVLHAAHELFASLDGFVDQVRGLSGRLVGDLSIGLLDNIITLDSARLAQALARFYQRDQDVRLQFFVQSPTELELAVLDGHLHLAIGYVGHRLPSLSYRNLFSEKVSIYCGERHPLFGRGNVTLAELESYPWVKRGYLLPSSLLPVDPGRLALTATAHHMEAVAHLVLANSHLGYLPQHYARQWVEQGKMHALNVATHSYVVEHSLITHGGRPHNEALDALMTDILAEHAVTSEQSIDDVQHCMAD